MVVAFEPEHFQAEVIPELKHLTGKGIVRVVDAVLVARDGDGFVSGHELAEVLGAENARFCSSQVEDATEWFTQDDIDVVGSTLPSGASVALLLFEHKWAIRLDDAVQDINTRMLAAGNDPSAIAAEIEHLLVLGSGSEVVYGSRKASPW
jgi:hypothetical protein